jgi:3-deoxy-D-manno-octulosonic-acid transferase
MYFVYGILLGVWFVVTAPFWWWQRLRHGKHQGVRERLGRVPERLRRPEGDVIWVHAVSVGEVLAVTPVVEELRGRYPKFRVVVSTVTDTGQKLARERFGEANVFYFPLDFAFAVRSYVEALRPLLVVIAETEFWPNFLRLAKSAGARIAVINARISDRSFPGYKRFRGLLKHVLANIELFLAQTAEDRERLIAIGAAAERVRVSGNLKFELMGKATPTVVGRLRTALNAGKAGPLMVCGSTVDDEEQVVIAAFKEVQTRYSDAVIVLAPRHPERFADVARMLETSGVKFWRRSQWNDEALSGGIFLLDNIGELAAIYQLADVAFVGGSLVPRGGHNILEPASAGVATLVGPHTENFRDIVNLFRSGDGVRTVTRATLGRTFIELLADDAARSQMGRRAFDIFKMNSGAKEQTFAALDTLVREIQPQLAAGSEPAPAASSRRV